MNDPISRAARHQSAYLIVPTGRDRALCRVLRSVVDQVVEGDGTAAPPDGDFDLVVAVSDGVPSHVAQWVELYGKPTSKSRLLLCMPSGNDKELVELFCAVARCNNMANDGGEVNADELIVTIRKIATGDIFGIDKYFVWGIELTKLVLRSSSDKGELLQSVARFADGLRVTKRFSSALCTIADELATNALFNAPRGTDGSRPYAHLHRNQEVTLAAGEQIEINLCSDGRRVGISASDPFGSLEPRRVLDYLAKCLRRGDDQVDDKPGGAGLGLYYVFDAVSHFAVNIAPGRRTEMIGLIDLTGGFKGVAARGKSFNLFVGD